MNPPRTMIAAAVLLASSSFCHAETPFTLTEIIGEGDDFPALGDLTIFPNQNLTVRGAAPLSIEPGGYVAVRVSSSNPSISTLARWDSANGQITPLVTSSAVFGDLDILSPVEFQDDPNTTASDTAIVGAESGADGSLTLRDEVEFIRDYGFRGGGELIFAIPPGKDIKARDLGGTETITILCPLTWEGGSSRNFDLVLFIEQQ